MEAIAKFEKVSRFQFLKDCWKAAGYEGEFQYLKDGDNVKYGQAYCEEVGSFTTNCTYIWEHIKLPTRATSGSAGYDFYIPDGTHLGATWYQLIPTGIRCKIKPGYVLMLYPRSSLGFKHAFGLANTTGIIDSDYYNAANEGHIMIKASAIDLNLEAGDRFIQGIFLPYYLAEEDEVTTERSGGLGSTGA